MMKSGIENILSVIREGTGNYKQALSLHEPFFTNSEIEYVTECIRSGWVSSVGSFVEAFSDSLQKYTRSQFAIPVVNGTAALQTCYYVAGIQSNDEVLMPALTFVATANALAVLGGVPHFVDVEQVTLGIDPEKLECYLHDISEVTSLGLVNKHTQRTIKALVVMHTFGHPSSVHRLKTICEKFGIFLIEDACEALGSWYDRQHLGTFGHLAALSFNGNKIITTGGGGAILTQDKKLAERVEHITKTAKQPHPWAFYHDEIGFNYRMPNINAALGLAQMEKIDFLLQKKRILAARYEEAFSNINSVKFIKEPSNAISNYWLNTIQLSDELVSYREILLERAHSQSIQLRPVWNPLHQLPMYKNCPRMDLSMTEFLSMRLINLPSSVGLIQ